MLKVMINWKEAALSLDAEVVLKLKNNLIEERKEDATYPFTLSLPANRHIFGHIERIVGNNFATTYPAQILFGPYNLLNGNAVITEVNGDEIELYISSAKKTFWGAAETMLSVGINVSPGSPGGLDSMMQLLKDSLTTEKPYVACPLYDPTMLSIPMTRGTDKEIKQFYINYYANGNFQVCDHDNRYSVFCLFPRLYEVIKKCIENRGYTIGLNYLLSIPNFKNILIINRQHLRCFLNASQPNLNLDDFLPKIKVKDFMEEIERKFGVNFMVNEFMKVIDIVSFNDFKTSSRFLEITDHYQKNILDPDDVETEYRFVDASVDDPYLKPGEIYFETSGGDAKQIECISTTVGEATPEDYCQVAAINSGDTNTYDESDPNGARVKEFRLAIYNGLILSVLPKMSSDWNGLSLRWGFGLYESFHQSKTEFLISRKQKHKLWVDTTNLNVLYGMRELFKGYVVCRGQKYVMAEQEIKLSLTKIVEYSVSGYPV